MLNRIIRRHWPLLIAYVPLFLLLRDWFKPGLILGEDFQPQEWLSPFTFSKSFPWPYAYDSTYGFGYSMQLRLSMYPFAVAGHLLANIWSNWALIERALFLFPLCILLVLAPYCFTMRFLKDPWVSAVVAVLFSLNTWTVGLVERGHIPALLAYALLPFVMWQAIEAIAKPSRSAALLLGLTLSLECIIEFRYAYLAVLCCSIIWLAAFIPKGRPQWTSRHIVFLAIAIGTLIALNIYWLLPLLLAPPNLPGDYVSLDWFFGLSGWQSVLRNIALFYPFYHHIESGNGFSVAAFEPDFLVLGAICLVGFIVRRSTPVVRYMALIWALGVIVASGPRSAFGPIDIFLFLHFPGMGAFRDITKVMALSIFTGSFGFGCALTSFNEKILKRSKLWRFTSVTSLIIVLTYVLLLHDAYNPLRFSMFRTWVPDREESALQDFLITSRPGRILYFPAIPEWVSPDPRHPGLAASMASSMPPPLGFSPININTVNLFAFWSTAAAHHILCITDTKYVIVDRDRFADLYEPWQDNIEQHESIRFFSRIPWLKHIPLSPLSNSKQNPYVAFSVENCPEPHKAIFIARFPVFAVMDPALYGDIVEADDNTFPDAVFPDTEESYSRLRSVRNVVVGANPAVDQPASSNLPVQYLFSEYDRGDATNPPGITFIKDTFTNRHAFLAKIHIFARPVFDDAGEIAQIPLEQIRASNGVPYRLADDVLVDPASGPTFSIVNPRALPMRKFSLISNLAINLSDHPIIRTSCKEAHCFRNIDLLFRFAASGEQRELFYAGPEGSDAYDIDLRAVVQRALWNRFDRAVLGSRDIEQLYSTPRFEATSFTLTGIDALTPLKNGDVGFEAGQIPFYASVVIPHNVTGGAHRVVEESVDFTKRSTWEAIKQGDIKIASKSFETRAELRASINSALVGRPPGSLGLDVYPRFSILYSDKKPFPHLVFDLAMPQGFTPAISAEFVDPKTGKMHWRAIQYPSVSVRTTLPAWNVQNQIPDELATKVLPIAQTRSNENRAAMFQWCLHYDIAIGLIGELAFPHAKSLILEEIRLNVPLMRTIGHWDVNLNIANMQLAHWQYIPDLGQNSISKRMPEISLDGKRVAVAPWKRVTKEGIAGFQTSGEVSVGQGVHEIIGSPSGEMYPAYISMTTQPLKQQAGLATNIHNLNTSEYTAKVRGNDIVLALATPYSPQWSLVLLPSGEVASGNPLIDYFRFRQSFVNPQTHLMLDGCCNAWYVPHARGNILAIFVPTALIWLSWIIQLIVLVLGASLALIMRGRLK